MDYKHEMTSYASFFTFKTAFFEFDLQPTPVILGVKFLQVHTRLQGLR